MQAPLERFTQPLQWIQIGENENKLSIMLENLIQENVMTSKQLKHFSKSTLEKDRLY